MKMDLKRLIKKSNKKNKNKLSKLKINNRRIKANRNN